MIYRNRSTVGTTQNGHETALNREGAFLDAPPPAKRTIQSNKTSKADGRQESRNVLEGFPVVDQKFQSSEKREKYRKSHGVGHQEGSEIAQQTRKLSGGA